jgi:cyclopropane fatty-acyl-phospholipid synthase-like methyltransferase
MITADGWRRYCIWEHSSTVRDLYARRCRLEAEEMTCAAQAADLLAPHVAPGDVLLDVGCGSGYFFHSLRKRNLPVQYYGVDAAPSLIEIGQQIMPQHGLPADRLQVVRIEDLGGSADHVICMNVLSNLDNFHRPLERILHMARKTLILRESISDATSYQYVTDNYLDSGHRLNVYVNTYSQDEIVAFMRAHGFTVTSAVDRRTNNAPEFVIDHPHYWKFLIAARNTDQNKGELN